MKIIKITLLASLLSFMINGNKAYAQIDPHFSQYYANPIWLNPALTGVTDGEYRVNVNAKQQWHSLGKGYLTGGASFDMAPAKNFAFGGMVINQAAGEISYNQLNALLSSSYRLRLGAAGDKILNFGIQAGILSKSFDASKITLGSQYNPGQGYDPGMGFNETIETDNYLTPDINAGVMYFDAEGNKNVNIFAGAAVSHLGSLKEKFLGNDARMPIRFTGHGGARIKVNHLLDITPNFLYMSQGNATEVAAGAYAKLLLNAESDLIFGSNYRFDDAAIAFLGFKFKNTTIGVSYDFNTSTLNKAIGSRGGLELSVSFTSMKNFIGPNFFCPRL